MSDTPEEPVVPEVGGRFVVDEAGMVEKVTGVAAVDYPIVPHVAEIPEPVEAPPPAEPAPAPEEPGIAVTPSAEEAALAPGQFADAIADDEIDGKDDAP